MTPEAQRIAIAEACGWRRVRKEPPFNKPWDAPLGTSPGATYEGEGFEKVPDYLNDLNAMHEAEKAIPRNDCHSGDQSSWSVYCRRLTVSATAAQRAEAFLRTIGKWQDSTEQKAHKCTQ